MNETFENLYNASHEDKVNGVRELMNKTRDVAMLMGPTQLSTLFIGQYEFMKAIITDQIPVDTGIECYRLIFSSAGIDNLGVELFNNLAKMSKDDGPTVEDLVSLRKKLEEKVSKM